MGDCARRAVQRFIGLSRPDRTSERSKGGNAEVDIAGIWHEQKISMSDSKARNWRATGYTY